MPLNDRAIQAQPIAKTDSNVDKVFNTAKNDYERPQLFLGSDPGLFDTINKRYPELWAIYKTLRSQDWDENEFDYSSCIADFKACSKSTYDIMIKTLAWQWEADSVAAHCIVPIFSHYVTSDELWAGILRWGENEALHAATYSEIVRNSFDDPQVIIDEVLSVTEAMGRLETVATVFSEAKETGLRYELGEYDKDDDRVYDALFMFIVALYSLERIQFMSSFAVTFGLADTGMFQPIGKAVQKIAQDEYEIHVQFGEEILKYELGTERGKSAYQRLKPRINALVNEVTAQEIKWTHYLFSEGREMVGVNQPILASWAVYNAQDVYRLLELESPYSTIKSNPLKYMDNWLDISKTQASPQEQDNAQYRVNVVRRDDEELEFDF